MKKTLYSIIILSLLISCEKEINVTPNYSVFQTDLTDLELRKLFGKVKECTLFNSHIKKSETPIIVRKDIFTEFGSIEKTENFDSSEKTKNTTIRYYDKKNYLVKTVTKTGPSKFVSLIERDSINKSETTSIFANDKHKNDYIRIYGEFDKIIKFITVKNGDSVIRNMNYKYDSNNNIILYEYETTSSGKKNINQYKYNKSGNNIEIISDSDNSRKKKITEYKDNILTKITEYNISSDSVETLKFIIQFDKYYNEIHKKIYKDSKLNLEIKNEYMFDKYGNWIEKKVYQKKLYNNSTKFLLFNIHKREISYWK